MAVKLPFNPNLAIGVVGVFGVYLVANKVLSFGKPILQAGKDVGSFLGKKFADIRGSSFVLRATGFHSGKPASNKKLADVVERVVIPYGGFVRAVAGDNDALAARLVAMIYIESRGINFLVGDAGEVGIMQVTSGALSDVVLSNPSIGIPLPPIGLTFITDARTNIIVGSAYLALLTKQFGGNVHKALIAYNGGPGNVVRKTVSIAAQQYAMSVSNLAIGINRENLI